MRRRKVLAQSVRHAVEALESRTLLSSTLAATAGTATITGVVFNDLLGDGVRDTGDPAIAGATVTIMQLGVVYAPGTVPTVQADDNGGFGFTGLAGGQYDVNVVPLPGFVQDAPATMFVTVSANDTISVAVGESGNPAASGSGIAAINGTLFNDVNQSGVYQPVVEDFLSGDTVYIDLNGSGVLTPNDPIAITNNIGQYAFTVAPGSYEIRMVPRPGFHQDPPGYAQVTLYSGQTVTQNIGENNRATLTGNVFIDANGNGVQDAGELPISGETVYLDQNYDGVLEAGTYNPTSGGFDAGEPFSTSNASGLYTFTGLTPGNYRITVLSAQGLVQDTPGFIDVSVAAGQDLVQNVGEGTPSSFSGTVYDDRKGSGTMVPGDTPLPNQLVYLDTNNNGVYDETGVGSNGLPEIGPSTTYPVPINTLVTLDGETTTLSNLSSPDLAQLTMVASGNTTVMSDLAASDVPPVTGTNNPALGISPAGTMTLVDPTYAQITLSTGTDTPLVTDLYAAYLSQFSPTGTGTIGIVVGTDLAAGTVTLAGQGGGTQTFTLAPGATVEFNNVASTLAAVNLGAVTIQAAEPAPTVTDVNGNFTIPNLGPGTYTARVVDPPGAVPTGPANATHSITFTVTSGATITGQNFGFQTPDLTANLVGFPTAPTLSTVTKKALVRITNVGSLPDVGLAGITLWAQPSSGVVDTSSAFLIGTVPGRPVKLQVGHSKMISVVFSYPTQLQENSYYVSAQVVSTVHDNNKGNDFSPPVGPVQVGPPYIDLSLTYTGQPQRIVAPGQPVPVSLTVTNLGNVTTTGNIALRVYLTTTPSIEPNDIVLQTYTFKNPHLKPGQSKIFNVTVPYPGPNLGFRYINWDVDSGDPLGETNLLNNILIESYQTRFD